MRRSNALQLIFCVMKRKVPETVPEELGLAEERLWGAGFKPKIINV